MTEDVATAFFEDLGARGYEPLLSKVSGTLRFDLVSGKTTERWLVAIRKGNLAVSRKNVAADTTIRLTGLSSRRGQRRDELFSAMLRGEVVLEGDYRLMILVRRLFRKRLASPNLRGRRLCKEAAMNDGLVKILDGNTFVVSDERGDIEASLTDPTGLFSFDTRFLSRWVLTIERRAAQRALHRRSPVLRDPLLPRSRHRHGLRRRQALGDPPASGRERLRRGADHPQPRREAGRPQGPHRGRERLRRPVRGQGRPPEEGQLLQPGAGRQPGALLPAGDVQEGDDDLGHGAGENRQVRPDLSGPPRAARRPGRLG